jgi:cyclase
MKRIIPIFLVKGVRLVKGTCFKDYVDVGDPVSQAMIYDAQGADEIALVDIDATREKRTINVNVITEMIKKCRLPIAAGGGIGNIDDARKCFRAGADKIIVNTQAVLDPSLIKKLALEFGSQSVLISLDVKKDNNNHYSIYTHSGKRKAKTDLETVIKSSLNNGAGEIMVTSIDKEGTLSGTETDLYKKLRNIVNVPLIASGGVGCYDHMVNLFQETDVDAVGIGKMLFLRDYDVVRIKSYLTDKKIPVRDA